MKALLVIVLVLATAAVANASTAAERYGQCLEKRVIAKHGYAWAVNHAGSTVCDR